jgi:ethanolamine utilization cobalamin adenosyltransferase
MYGKQFSIEGLLQTCGYTSSPADSIPDSLDYPRSVNTIMTVFQSSRWIQYRGFLASLIALYGNQTIMLQSPWNKVTRGRES